MIEFTSCTSCFENVLMSEVLDVEKRNRIVRVNYLHGVCGEESAVMLDRRIWNRYVHLELLEQMVFGFAQDLEDVRFVDDLELV